MGVKPSLIHAL